MDHVGPLFAISSLPPACFSLSTPTCSPPLSRCCCLLLPGLYPTLRTPLPSRPSPTSNPRSSFSLALRKPHIWASRDVLGAVHFDPGWSFATVLVNRTISRQPRPQAGDVFLGHLFDIYTPVSSRVHFTTLMNSRIVDTSSSLLSTKYIIYMALFLWGLAWFAMVRCSQSAFSSRPEGSALCCLERRHFCAGLDPPPIEIQTATNCRKASKPSHSQRATVTCDRHHRSYKLGKG